MRLFTKLTVAAVAAAGSVLIGAEVIDLTNKDLWLPMKNVEFSEGKMVNNGRAMFRSKKLIAIDPAKKYTFKMTIAAPEAQKSSYMLWGLFPANAKGQLLTARTLQSYPGTFTTVVEAAPKGATAVKVKDGSKWSKSTSGLIAFDAKEDNSDIPTGKIIPCSVKDIKKEGDVWVLTLRKPLTRALAANAAIRQHSDGGYYYFGARMIGKNPVTAKTTVTGQAPHGHYTTKGFHPGMKYAYLVILSDWNGMKNNVEIKDATFTIE